MQRKGGKWKEGRWKRKRKETMGLAGMGGRGREEEGGLERRTCEYKAKSLLLAQPPRWRPVDGEHCLVPCLSTATATAATNHGQHSQHQLRTTAMPHSTASSPTTPASPASEPPSARTSSHPHTSLSSTAASPSSSSSFAPTTPPPATASHSSAYRQSPSLSPSISSTSAGASAAAAAGGGGTAPHTPPPVMRFQKNLALQKHQATMEDRRGHTVWMQKYRAVYEQVSREYASAKVRAASVEGNGKCSESMRWGPIAAPKTGKRQERFRKLIPV
ncbi:hypothetical protein BDZ88DRAFT_28262 [Geranomyces variabilis]|nr:hypothetical protein BDZ88DRAFT_28262 [Geranomyces variabilis]